MVNKIMLGQMSFRAYVKLITFMIAILSYNGISGEHYTNLKLQSRQTTICAERNVAGLICESCDRLAFCVKINGIWHTYPVELCDFSNGQYCNIYEGKCTDAPGPCNRLGYEGNFPCTSDGIFPDPYDCQIYHMCYQAEPDVHDYLPIAGTAKCGGKRAYSVNTSDCSLTLLDDVCKKRQYNCNFPGESHSWPNNPNIFYICQPEITNKGKHFLYPTLYRCAPGEIYNNNTCLSMDSHDKSTRFPPVINTSTNPITEKPEISCEETLGIIPDPKDCYSYYHCISKNGPAIHRVCPKNTFFNQITLSCTLGDCRNNYLW